MELRRVEGITLHYEIMGVNGLGKATCDESFDYDFACDENIDTAKSIEDFLLRTGGDESAWGNDRTFFLDDKDGYDGLIKLSVWRNTSGKVRHYEVTHLSEAEAFSEIERIHKRKGAE